MENNFVVLTTQESMWASMLMDVLADNGITATALPVFGAGLALKAGMQEQLRIYVPQECLSQAQELLDALFNSEFAPDEDSDED